MSVRTHGADATPPRQVAPWIQATARLPPRRKNLWADGPGGRVW
jgi:hypothetical protein